MASLIINNGRKKQCKNSIGGLKNFYLAPFVKAKRSEIIYDGVTVTNYPQTFVYKFEIEANTSFSQTQSENDGGKFYNQNLSLSFFKISAFDNVNFSKFLNREYLCVVEDFNKNFFLLGFKNGVICEKLDLSTEGIYTLSFEGQEENLAPFCESLVGTSLVVFDNVNYIFQDESDYIFQNNDNYILNGN